MTLRRGILLLWLVFVWVTLWENLTVANVLSGVLVAGLLVVVFPLHGRGRQAVRPLALLRYAGYFLGKLVEANAQVAWKVLNPRSEVHEGIVAVTLDDAPDGLVSLVANSITLTPGTLTLDVHRGEGVVVLYVHVLDLRSVEAAKAEVVEFDRRARLAFPPPPPAPTPSLSAQPSIEPPEPGGAAP